MMAPAPAQEDVTLPGQLSIVPGPDAAGQKDATRGQTTMEAREEPPSDVLHVRGIGVDGWDGAEHSRGAYQSEEAIKKIFSVFGPVRQVTIRHRIGSDAGTGAAKNTSWALVHMETPAAVDAALAAKSVMAGAEPLVLTRYSQKQAASSTGGMRKARLVSRTRSQENKIGLNQATLGARHEARQNDVVGLDRDKQLHPHMLEAEIKDLGWLFDEYAKSSSGELYIDRTAVQHMLEEALEHLYNKIDMDQSGTLGKTEVKALLDSLGVLTTSAEMDLLMTELDADGDGQIGLREFMGWWEHRQYDTQEDQERELEDLFKAVDKDGSGRIDWDEFLNLVANQLHRHEQLRSGPDRDPLDAAAMVRFAIELVQADTRAIYGSSGKTTGRVNMRGESINELQAMNRRCFFRPNGKGGSVQFRHAWDLLQIVMLFYVALVVPFRIGFDEEAKPSHWIFWWEVLVDLYFWLDIVMNFRTGQYDENNELVVDQRKVCKKYLQGWFVLDFISVLPVTYIGYAMNGHGSAETGGELKLMKVFRMLRLAKLLRLARLKRLVRRLVDQYEIFAKASRLTSIMLAIVFFAHLVACAWHLAGSSGEQEIGTDRSTGEKVKLQPWVTRQYGGIGDGSTEHPDFEKGLRVSVATRYLDAAYYSVTTLTTVGYGDRLPSTNMEKVISILCELAGSMIFGIIAGALSAVAMSESMTRAETKEKISQLDELMQQKNVPAAMRVELSHQMSYWFDKKSVFDEDVLLSYLPPRQRKDLLAVIYKPFLMQCPLMQHLEWPVLSRLCLMMRPYFAVVNDVIFAEADIGEEMYLVVRGSIKLSSTRFPAYNSRLWEDGAFFGELPLLNCGDGSGETRNLHVYAAQAVVETDCSYITQDDFNKLNLQRPTLRTTMRMHALQRAVRFGTDVAARRLGVDNLPTSASTAESSSRLTSAEASGMTSAEHEVTPAEDWFKEAAKSAPHLLKEEITDLRAVFVRYANRANNELSVANVQQLLDDSLKESYKQLDDDGSGSLERNEILRLLRLLGMSTTQTEMDHFMAQLDEDGSGQVEFEEFKTWWDGSQFGSAENQKQELQDLFDMVDTDRSGAIDWDEFLHLVSTHVLRDLELANSANALQRQSGNSPLGSTRKARSAADMVRVALNTVRNDTRAIYGTANRAHTVQLQFGQEVAAMKKRCLFRPDGGGAAVKFRQLWDVAQAFILFYVALSEPYRVGFSSEPTAFGATFWWDVVVDIYFWCDILLNFRTAHYDRYTGELVIDQKNICTHYLRGWFLVDTISCLPIRYTEMLMYGAEQQAGSDLMALKILRLFRLAKLLRLIRVKRLFTRLEMQYKSLAQTGRVAKICFVIMLAGHYVACAWYFVGAGEDQRLGVNAAGDEVILSPWVRNLYGNIEEGVCVESGVELSSPECDQYSKYTVSQVTKYLDALYYSVTTLTTVGYGDRVPSTDSEKILSILFELAGTMTFGIVAGSLSAIAMSENISTQEVKARRGQLDEFMKTKKVPKALRQELGTQLANYFERKSALDEKQIIACLPPKHQKELIMAIYQPFLVDCPLVQGLERGLTSQLCLAMRPYFAFAGDQLVVEGEIGEEMYLITRGTIKLESALFPDYNNRLWEDGAFFGELPLLDCGAEDTAVYSRKVLHVYTATALIDSQCTYVTQEDLDELNLKRPELKQTMRKYAMQRAERFGMHIKDDEPTVETRKSGPGTIIELAETAKQFSEALLKYDLDRIHLESTGLEHSILLDQLSAVDLQNIHNSSVALLKSAQAAVGRV